MKIESLVPLLNVSDVRQSCAFYEGALGFRVGNQWEDQGRVRWASIECGAIQLMINEHGAEAETRRVRGEHQDVVPYISVQDADAAHAHLRSKGFEPDAVQTETYGLRQFSIRDPDGYELAITGPSHAAHDR